MLGTVHVHFQRLAGGTHVHAVGAGEAYAGHVLNDENLQYGIRHD
jgi:hypothetical protein